jgi:hypothetical protein
MGYLVDLPTDEEKLQQRRLPEQSQPLEQLDEVIDEDQRADDQISRRCQRREAEQKGVI